MRQWMAQMQKQEEERIRILQELTKQQEQQHTEYEKMTEEQKKEFRTKRTAERANGYENWVRIQRNLYEQQVRTMKDLGLPYDQKFRLAGDKYGRMLNEILGWSGSVGMDVKNELDQMWTTINADKTGKDWEPEISKKMQELREKHRAGVQRGEYLSEEEAEWRQGKMNEINYLGAASKEMGVNWDAELKTLWGTVNKEGTKKKIEIDMAIGDKKALVAEWEKKKELEQGSKGNQPVKEASEVDTLPNMDVYVFSLCNVRIVCRSRSMRSQSINHLTKSYAYTDNTFFVCGIVCSSEYIYCIAYYMSINDIDATIQRVK